MRRSPGNPFRLSRLASIALALSLAGAAIAAPAPDDASEARWLARARERVTALKARPGDAALMADLGETLLTAGQYSSARKALERAKTAGSSRADFLLAECALLAEGATREEAKKALSLATSADASDPQAALLESLAKEVLGDVDGALDAAVRGAELAGQTDGIGEELAHRMVDRLERCVHWSRVFSLVE